MKSKTERQKREVLAYNNTIRSYEILDRYNKLFKARLKNFNGHGFGLASELDVFFRKDIRKLKNQTGRRSNYRCEGSWNTFIGELRNQH